MRLEHSEKTRTFSDYLATMNAKYRKAAKDTFAAIDKGNCTVDVVTDLKEWDERFYALYLHVHHRATVRPTCIAPGYFSALARHLGPSHFRATIIQRDGRLLGFVTTIKDGDTAIGYMIGFDDQANDELPLYFRLLYATVEQGLAFGCRSLSLGRTALEAKSKLGAKPVSLHVAMRMKNPATNALIRPFLRWIPHAEAPDRTVFKA
jgi:predicted N-acyltransferase